MSSVQVKSVWRQVIDVYRGGILADWYVIYYFNFSFNPSFSDPYTHALESVRSAWRLDSVTGLRLQLPSGFYHLPCKFPFYNIILLVHEVLIPSFRASSAVV
jgi:hypothetical protein